MRIKTACFFGIYDPAYGRNRVLMDGLRAGGVDILECRVDPRRYRGLRKYLALWRQARRMRGERIDCIVAAFPGHTVVWLARLLGAPVVFDAFLSLYDSNVRDRQLYGPRHPRAWADRFWDWFGCRMADRVLLDTDAHIGYFVRTFGIPRDKFIRVWIGADDRLFHPRAAPLPQIFTVHFHGTFIPLQGIETILDAARLLSREAVQFRIVGSGQEYPRMQALARELGLRNVEFIGRVPLERVPEHIAAAHACLGIFGSTDKAGRVIPNKVYECIAMGKPVISADTPAMREVFTDGADVLLCTSANGAALADAIRRLRDDAALRERIGAGGRRLFESNFAPERLGAYLLSKLA